jgi:hypothetical protein
MASTYSNLKIELIGTGDQAGAWGFTTNNNLQFALEQAIVGSANVTFTSADVTLTLTNSNLSQTARNLRLNLIGTSGGVRNLYVPAIQKFYIINNNLADEVLVRNATGGAVTVAAGKSTVVYNDGTDVVDAINNLDSLSLNIPLAIADGGTGETTQTDAFNALAPTTTKGDLIVNNGTDNVRFAADPNNNYVLTTDSTTATGLKWSPSAAGGAVTLVNDTATATNLFPAFANATSGTVANLFTSNSKLLYKPSTGDFQASQVVASNGLVVNSDQITSSYTIATGTNAMCVGPITVASGQSVTVSSGQRWIVL